MRATTPLPLDGFTVLDLSTLLPGPYCTTLLQTYGARIIKVETPAGDPVRKMSPAFFSQFNRGKASVVIDLKTDEGRRNLIRLAKQADALIEGFRPGVMARLGVGYDAMSAENPAIVYCSLSGFGQSGPYRDRPAHDLNFLGLAGYYSIPSQIDGAISRPNVRMADLVAGQTAAMAMAMAMISARQSGSGAHLDCSIYDSVAHWSIPLILANNGAASQDPADYSLVMADSGLFATRDGRYISLGTLEDKFWAALVEAIGHVEPRLNDDKWSTRRGRDSNKRELHDILTSCFLKKDRSEWALILDDIETAWGLVYQGGEVLQDNHLVARELISTEGGEVCAYPVRFLVNGRQRPGLYGTWALTRMKSSPPCPWNKTGPIRPSVNQEAIMLEINKNFINGQWVPTNGTQTMDMVNPATERVFGKLTLATVTDVDNAVAAAAAALSSYRNTSKQERLLLIQRIGEEFKKRMPDLVQSVVEELGAPLKLAQGLQVPSGLMQVAKWSELLTGFSFSEKRGNNEVVFQPVGVCALVTSWNWPINGIAGVLLPALAAGCTVVWKPSELAASTSTILVEILEKAGVPAGVVNMVIGDGRHVGNRLVSHPDVRMVSFTGSAETGSTIAAAIAPQTKRLVQELGGKSPYIILDGADFVACVKDCAIQVFRNTGQTCTTPSRLLVPQERMEEAAEIAATVANTIKVGDPSDGTTDMGPLGNENQWEKVNAFITDTISAGTSPIAGGPGRPEQLDKGYFAKPTVFANVENNSRLAQEEIFGPVLAIVGYSDEADAVAKANDTAFGLSAYVQGDPKKAHEIALQIEAGMVHVNGAPLDFMMPFGGVKRSGNGRKLGREGLLEYLEPKSIYVA